MTNTDLTFNIIDYMLIWGGYLDTNTINYNLVKEF